MIFQVAGLCGDGALKEASELHKWGIGVDADEYKVAKRILTSALKKTDVGVYDTIVSAANGHFKGGKDLLFNLKNNGVGVAASGSARRSSLVDQADEQVQDEDPEGQAQAPVRSARAGKC